MPRLNFERFPRDRLSGCCPVHRTGAARNPADDPASQKMETDMTKKPRRIHRVEVENYMGLAYADISLAPTLVQICGRNGSGKSSALSAIDAAICRRLSPRREPIRDGAERALIRVSVGGEEIDAVVIRSFARGDDGEPTVTKIAIRTADGIPLRDASSFVKDLVGDGPLDPLKFMTAKEPEQLATLRRFVQDVDFDDVERKRKAVYDARTDVGREVTRSIGARDALIFELRSAPPAGRPQEAILADLNSVNGLARAHDEWERLTHLRAQELERARQAVDQADAESARREEALKVALCAARDRREELNRLEVAPLIPEPPRPPERDRLDVEMRDAMAQAGIQAKRDRLAGLISEVEGLEKKRAAHSAELERMDSAVLEAIAATKMPVEGLTIDGDMVRLDGHPFEQANTARRLAASVAVVMASAPPGPDKLRTLWIQDGSTLDDASLNLVDELARAAGWQVIVERVTNGEDVPDAIVIEAGTVKGAAPRRPAPSRSLPSASDDAFAM